MKETLHYDESTDKLHVKHDAPPLEPIFDQIKDIKQDWDGRSDTSLGYFVGHIPNWVIQDYLNRTGVNYEAFMADTTHVDRILKDPDFKKLRIWEGKY